MAVELLRRFVAESGYCVSLLLSSLRAGVRCRALPPHLAFFTFEGGSKKPVRLEEGKFFLRTSTEYSNPQLTLEDLQGIIVARLLEACANYLYEHERGQVEEADFGPIAQRLAEPPRGAVAPFLLNTDDVEPDRYSINPLRSSIVESGQSAFPASSVRVSPLSIDRRFVSKYSGSLVSSSDVELIEHYIGVHAAGGDSYLDLVDSVKFHQLAEYSARLGLELRIPALRMPLSLLKDEAPGGALHRLIEDCHRDYSTLEKVYELMGRNILKRKTLLPAVPHSPKGYGSKKRARGKLIFNNQRLVEVRVSYTSGPLYPNEVDRSDVSVAKAEDDFTLPGEALADYSFQRAPCSPQFALYSILSPENAVVCHGVGRYSGREIVQSYASVHAAHSDGKIFRQILRCSPAVPVMFDLVAERMIGHPKLGNIDASVGCVEELERLVLHGTCIRTLNAGEYIRPLRA